VGVTLVGVTLYFFYACTLAYAGTLVLYIALQQQQQDIKHYACRHNHS
jgi:hypothetical protein